ncbi:putative VP2 [Microviridae sp.]|nr:putative VP2 [Microviridae sp.]
MEIYKYLNLRIVDSPFDSRKHWIPAAIAAAASIGSTVLTNQSNKKMASDSFERQKDYSNWLLRNQTQESVKDLRAAGLNPAFMNGSQLANTPSAPQYDTPSVQSPLDFGSALMFAQVAANTRKANADAESQELLNEDKKKRNDVIAHNYDDSVWMLDGKLISEDEANRILLSSGSDKKLPDFVVRPYPSKGAEGRLQGEQLLKRWDKELSDINVTMVQNELQEMVSKGQITNPNVLEALENMPYRAYSELVAKTENVVKDTLKKEAETTNLGKQGLILDVQKTILELEKQITEDSNIYQYINKIGSGSFTLTDAIKVVVMGFVGLIQRFNFSHKF